MKLRIQGNLVRLRLTQKEVACLQDRGGRVECALRFPTGRALSYSVLSSPDAAWVSVDYKNDSLRVVLPHALAAAWAGSSSQVSIEGDPNSAVEILVEKDFQCLHKSVEQEPDAYPHPLAAG
jgi:hypothetical protein